jgi:hypothetical protein
MKRIVFSLPSILLMLSIKGHRPYEGFILRSLIESMRSIEGSVKVGQNRTHGNRECNSSKINILDSFLRGILPDYFSKKLENNIS